MLLHILKQMLPSLSPVTNIWLHFYSYDTMHYGVALLKWFRHRLLTRTLIHWTCAGIRGANAIRLNSIPFARNQSRDIRSICQHDIYLPRSRGGPTGYAESRRQRRTRWPESFKSRQSCNAEYKSSLSLRPGGYRLF